MASPYGFAGATYPYEDMAFHSQPYSGMDDLVDPTMTSIDPNLQSSTPTPYNLWDPPVQRFLNDNQKTFFVAEIPRQMTDRTPVRPTVGVPAVPPPSQIRFASPMSSIEPSSSGSGLSPPTDTESYYENYPRTPPDTALLSPFQAPLPLEPFSNAHVVQFTGTGLDYVNPLDVNPNQSDYCESDNGIIDFSAQLGYSFDSYTSSHCSQRMQSNAVSGLGVQRMASPEEMRSVVEDEIKASSQYPPPPKGVDESMESDGDMELPRSKRQNQDDADIDYQPSKRPRPNRTRRGPKPTTPNTPSVSRKRTRPTTARPSTSSRAPLTCSDCNRRDFPDQASLDAHIKKQHKRPFNCVFDFAGCDSTFASKNEWKRHVTSQHLLLHYWVCTEGTCAKAAPSSPSSSSPPPSSSTPTGAIFNRKDLYTQHLKRMHAPKELKSSSSSSSKQSSPDSTETQSAWESRLRHLQQTAIRPRCTLPTLMRCPVAGCSAPPFEGEDAWNQRMEHVAKHLERAASASHNNKGRDEVVFGGEGDDTLVRWAARKDVAIIVRDGEAGWVLRSPLRRGPGGNVVVTAPVGGGKGGEVGEEIVVSSSSSPSGGEGGSEVDAEGEEDD